MPMFSCIAEEIEGQLESSRQCSAGSGRQGTWVVSVSGAGRQLPHANEVRAQMRWTKPGDRHTVKGP